MRKIKIAIATGVITYVLCTRPVYGAACTLPVSGDYTISSACDVAATGEVNGVDTASNQEASTTNTAILTIGSGVSITTLANSTLVVGSLVITDTAVINIGTGAQIKIGYPIYMTDADADGYPDDLTFAEATASGKRRRSLAKGTTVDCAPADATKWQNLSGYPDADSDTYAAASGGNVCSGASLPAGTSGTPGTDCDDANANVYLGSAYCGTVARANATYDYNCSTTDTVCGTTYNYDITTVSYTMAGCIGTNQTNCSGTSAGYTTYNAGSFGCGVTGYYATGSTTKYACGGSVGNCGKLANGTYVSSLGSGAQGCQ
jgi:hypothetical protein